MPKNLFQDMVKIKRANRQEQAPKEKTDFEPILREVNMPAQSMRGKGRPRYTLWFVAIISILFCIYSVSFLFGSATVTVTPKIKDVVLNENLSASKDASASGLSFNLIDNVSGEESKVLQATTPKDVSEKAQGTVIIYNAFSSVAQRLDIDTRLEGSNGKIYKTKKQIVVPGMKGNTPGSVEVGIYASSAGEAYNSEPLDFNIVGFKGTPKYSKFYGRSKGKIAGGFIGKVNVVSDADKASALADLQTSLKAKLLAKATNQIPSGFILFKDAVFLSTEDPIIPLTADQNNNLTITLKGALHGFIFNEQELTKKIAASKIDKYDGSPVYIANIRDLNFSLSAQANSANFSDLQNINFSLKGPTKIVWKLDEAKLVSDLLGKPKTDFNQVLLQYPNVDLAQSVINPFWRSSFPDKTKDIKVIVNYPK